MVQEFATPSVRGSAKTPTRTTRALLACGVVAGPLFIVVAFIQASIRLGFDPRRHPLSQLSLGDLGWIQITNFVVAGLLFLASAIGMRRVLRPGRGGTWGPWLVGIFGVSLIAGGVFVPDPAFGFPPGTPGGPPVHLSWHGIVHGIAFLVGFVLSLIAACIVFTRRFAALKQRGWATYCAATGVVVLALIVWSNLAKDLLPLWVAAVLGFGWASVIAARLMTEPANRRKAS